MILLLWPGKSFTLLLCSRKKKKKKGSKIKLRLCGKSIRWSSNDFQLCIITNLWPLEKHPLKRVVPIKCSLLQKIVYWATEESTQLNRRGKCKREGESWVSTVCTIPRTGCHNVMCCNKVCTFWILWKFKRTEPTLTHTHAHVYRRTILTSLHLHLQTCENTVPHIKPHKNPHTSAWRK